MKIRRFLLALLLLPATLSFAFADKGMWLLNELNQQNIDRMRELGFNMPIEKLYSLEQPSLSNAVVIFGGGCTGITVSREGLIFTNHHCGFDAIQSQSSVNHDYLRDGFVSQTFEQELPIADLQVKYLKDIVDVTDRINAELKGIKDEILRIGAIQELSKTILEEYSKEFVEAEVVPFYEGNKYYVVVYNVFRDVRMVMAPPSSVGKFGGDTDNWMWPRHTGDFSVFRVYADASNNPAAYSASNKPYKPVSYAKVSLNGYKPGDYAMTIGFPGSTQRYLTSWGVQDVVNNENAPRIEVRGIKQAIWKEAMEADQATRIKYASKYAGSSNYWKNSIGMNRGIAKLDVVGRKAAEEKAFTEWYTQKGTQAQYGHLLPDLKKQYEEIAEGNKDFTYLIETLWRGAEVPRNLASPAYRLSKAIGENETHAKVLREYLDDQYKDYSPELDRKVLPAMLDVLRKHGGEKLLPELYKTIDKKFKGSSVRYADDLFKKSFIPYESELAKVLALPAEKRAKKLEKDPAVILYKQIYEAIMKLQEELSATASNIEKNKRELFAAQRLMDPNRPMPSDANFTMRMSYGSVGGYVPQDGAYFNYYTTEKGVFEKQDPTSSEFAVQPELLSLFRSKDFGRYGVDGELRLCFLSDNDITGGNSGSPVFDGNGDLIGLAFDGNWEAMSGDIEFEPELQRTINVDIRYVLYMIDKWAKCPRLIEELTFVEFEPAAGQASGCSVAVKATCCKDKATQAGCPKAVKAGCDKAAKATCTKGAASKCAKAGNATTGCCKDKAAKAGCDKAAKDSCNKPCQEKCDAERQEKLRIASGCKCPKGTASCKGCKEGKACGCSKKSA